MPLTCGLCGSSAVSHLAWCLRWMATHSLVTMPVVSHSQKRKKWLTMGCRSTARCACERCRKMVTAAMVTWVSPSVTATTPHQGKSNKPNCMVSGSKNGYQCPVMYGQILYESRSINGSGGRCQVNDALREGNLDFGGLETAPDRPVDVGAQIILSFAWIAYPHGQFQQNPIIGKLFQVHPRQILRVVENHPLLVVRRLEQQRLGLLQIRIVGHLNRQCDPHVGLGQRVVDHRLRDQHLVRNDAFGAVERPEQRIAGVDLADLAVLVVDRDEIADAHRTVEQDDEAGDVVARDLLQAEAESHA